MESKTMSERPLTRRERYFKYPQSIQGLREAVESVVELQDAAASIVGGANPFSKEVMKIMTDSRTFVEEVVREAANNESLLYLMQRDEDISNIEIGAEICHAIAKMGHLEKRICDDFERFFEVSVKALGDRLLLVGQYRPEESARLHALVQAPLAEYTSAVVDELDYDDLVKMYSEIFEILEPVYGPLRRELEEVKLKHEIRAIREILGLPTLPET